VTGLLFAPNRISCLSSYVLYAGVRWAGYFCFEIGSWWLAVIMFDLIWCSMVYGGEGRPTDLVLKFGGPITFDSRLRVNSLAQVSFWVFVLCSFGGSEVERLWKLHVHSVRSFSNVARLGCWSLRVLFWGVFVWGWVVTMGGCGLCL